jgi:hypothetical protein
MTRACFLYGFDLLSIDGMEIRRDRLDDRRAKLLKKEIDRAAWSKPRRLRLTPTSRYIRDKVFPKRKQ